MLSPLTPYRLKDGERDAAIETVDAMKADIRHMLQLKLRRT